MHALQLSSDIYLNPINSLRPTISWTGSLLLVDLPAHYIPCLVIYINFGEVLNADFNLKTLTVENS